jgi:hypothetical protein
MVFIQYKTFYNGTKEKLDIKIIDVGGIFWERLACLDEAYNKNFNYNLIIIIN